MSQVPDEPDLYPWLQDIDLSTIRAMDATYKERAFTPRGWETARDRRLKELKLLKLIDPTDPLVR